MNGLGGGGVHSGCPGLGGGVHGMCGVGGQCTGIGLTHNSGGGLGGVQCSGSGTGVQGNGSGRGGRGVQAVTDGGSVVTVPGVSVMPCGAAPPPPAKLAV